jgi:N-acetylneuraminate synthase
MMSVFVIAEAGVNHNGDLDMAFRLIDQAVAAGADAVKFQTFKADRLATVRAPKAAYQNETTDSGESQHAMLRRLELAHDWHFRLIDHCRAQGIAFLSTPFELESLRFLTDHVKVDLLKLPSGEVPNGPLLLAAARSGRDIILSTGMATLGEVEQALQVLAFGYARAGMPTAEGLAEAYCSGDGQQALRRHVRLLHCTTEYPTPVAAVNLRAMETMARAFGLPVGLSDHTEGIAVSLGAVALGAEIIEKHFTLDRTLPGPDHKASLEPSELVALVGGVRMVEAALGSPVKTPAPAEQGNRRVVRKSLVAARDIRKGEVFSEENLDVKRPATGMSPMRYWDLLGQVAGRDYAPDEMI